VIDLLKNAACEALRRKREGYQGAETKMADGRVGDESLHIFLHKADDGAVDDADEREHDDDVDDSGAKSRVSGEKREREAKKTIRAHFQQDAGEDDGARRGGFRVRVRQPSVKREHGDFDGEGEKEAPEKPDFQAVWKLLRGGEKSGNVEGADDHLCGRV